jgi:hypothetical protein
MSKGLISPTLFVVAVVTILLCSRTAFADGDAGTGTTSGLLDAGTATSSPSTAPSPASTSDLPDETSVIKDIAKAISTKDWFLLAGGILAAVIYAVRYTLAKKWPKWNESHYGVFAAAGIAAITALAVAWTSGGDVASTHTLLGAVKLLAAATIAYVLPKKISQGMSGTPAA